MTTSSQSPGPLLSVALPVPLRQTFDYAWRGDGPTPGRGCRVRVPFGRRQLVGIVVDHPRSSTLPKGKIKAVIDCLDVDAPILSESLLGLLEWAAQYYCHALGEVLAAALPGELRRGAAAVAAPEPYWRLGAAGADQDLEALARRAPRQAELLQALTDTGTLADSAVKRELGVSAATLRTLSERGWIEPAPEPAPVPATQPTADTLPTLSDEQAAALGVLENQNSPGVTVIDGVTGSGKTEIYMRFMADRIREGHQALLLVPEIGLTPQLIGRLEARFGSSVVSMHSGLTARQRLASWRQAASGEASVIVGTRSAIFAPLASPAVIIVDEEHDGSYKQQDGFRYSARDLAVVRGQRLGIPVVLGSATPSFETLANVERDRYDRVRLRERVGEAQPPELITIDLKAHASQDGLSTPLVLAMQETLNAGNQVLIYINRRGFAPVLFCPTCEDTLECPRCDAPLTLHSHSERLRCHHCGLDRPLDYDCAGCGGERLPVGAGTQRIEAALASRFPDAKVARFDRDSLQRRGSFEAALEDVASGDTDILVGTQILAKGHDYPNVTLVGILDADQGLFGSDFRATEHLAQNLVQVSGRAGRGSRPGRVMIQTHYPEHPLLQRLISEGYGAFAQRGLEEREAAGWPPVGRLAVLRAEAHGAKAATRFLQQCRRWAEPQLGPGVALLGPAPAPMERRAGRYRAQLLVLSPSRKSLGDLLPRWLDAIAGWPDSRQVRYALDVDPLEPV